MNNNQQDIKAVAIRFFEGCATLDEQARLQQYLEHDPRNMQQFRLWEEEWIKAGASHTSSTDEAWLRLMQTIDAQEATTSEDTASHSTLLQHHETEQHRVIGLRLWHKIAAAAMLLLIVTLTALLATDNTGSVQTFCCEAPAGSHTRLTLPDGSVVWLNSASKLIYTNRFANDNRHVELKGEGFFEVTKHEGKPFTVHTADYDVTVKGTRFNVSAYDNDSLSTTTLINGKVELSNGSQHLTLSPGQAATLNRTTSKISLSKANTQADAWRTGKLMYRDISMKEFAQILERQYDVNVNIASPQCADMRISVMLQNNETIDEVLQAIEQITSHKASRNDRNITIR